MSTNDSINDTNNFSNQSGNQTELDDFCLESPLPQRQLVICGILVPLLIILGVTSNLLNVIIFRNRHMRRSLVNWYLAALALCDLTSLICSSFIVSFPVLAEWSGSGSLAIFTNYSLFLAYPLGNLTRTVSIYMTVAVSAHRFIGVCLPFRAHEICTRGNVRSLITTIFFFCTVYNIPKFLELTLNSCYSLQYDRTIPMIDASPMRMDLSYILGYLGWSNTIVLLVVPFSLLISMNIRVIREVQKMRKRHSSLCVNGGGATEQMRIESAKERSTTVMLIGIVFVFLTCNSLALVSNVLETIMNYFVSSKAWIEAPYTIICDISNFLVMIGMSINMLVYATFSDKYRILLKFFLSSASSLRSRNYLLDELSEAQSV